MGFTREYLGFWGFLTPGLVLLNPPRNPPPPRALPLSAPGYVLGQPLLGLLVHLGLLLEVDPSQHKLHVLV